MVPFCRTFHSGKRLRLQASHPWQIVPLSPTKYDGYEYPHSAQWKVPRGSTWTEAKMTRKKNWYIVSSGKQELESSYFIETFSVTRRDKRYEGGRIFQYTGNCRVWTEQASFHRNFLNMSIRIRSAIFVHDHLNDPEMTQSSFGETLWAVFDYINRKMDSPPKFPSSESLKSCTVFDKKKRRYINDRTVYLVSQTVKTQRKPSHTCEDIPYKSSGPRSFHPGCLRRADRRLTPSNLHPDYPPSCWRILTHRVVLVNSQVRPIV